MRLRSLAFTLAGIFSVGGFAKANVTIQSGPARTYLLELFTSEGCSSCPPAEDWFSTLRQSPRLWKEVVPVAFHINYWDDLGWTDPFATKAFTDRQRAYAASWRADNVYTPAFVLNGREWRERDLAAIPPAETGIGRLSATLHDNGEVRVTFEPSAKSAARWQAHAALLGFGIASNVRAGENDGRQLVHDFIALAEADAGMNGDIPRALLRLPADRIQPGRSALAVWITAENAIEPVQAAGGSL